MLFVNFVDSIKVNLSSRLALIIVMSLWLSACGAGGEDAGADNSDTQASTEEPIPDVVAAVQISSQPQSLNVDAGNNAFFTVSATGGGTLSFQWRKDEQNISGATTNSLALSNVTQADAALYDVIVSNSVSSQKSLAALLTVNPPVVIVPIIEPVVIVTQPQALTVDEASSASFSVQVTGDGAITYQWLKNGQVITGATSASFTLSSVSMSDAAAYRVNVTNSRGTVQSNSVALSVTALPEPVVIVTQPQALTVDEASSASFSVQVTGDGAITYQWLKNGQVITGATSASFTLSSVSMSDAASYRVNVTNSRGTVQSNSVALSVTALPEPVVIVTQPQALTVDEASSASFSVQVTGDGAITYQWLKNGQVITGATSASFTLSSVGLSDAASYRVNVTNSRGTVQSNAVALSVTALPEPVVIVTQPQALTVDEASSASFSVQVTGDGAITYQWLKNGGIIEGATSSNLSLGSVTLSDAGNYSVMIFGPQDTLLSDAANLSVNVVSVASSIELSWDIPQEREDGSDLPLGEINGYVIAYGTNENNLSNELIVDGASVTSIILENLESGTYYFAIATVDSDGIQGAFSGVINQSI